MQTGTKISGFLHLGALGFAVFGGVLFKAPPSEAIQISEVSIISAEDFAAMQSTAPDPSPEVVTAPTIKPPDPTQETAPKIAQPNDEDPLPDQQVALVVPAPVAAPRIDTKSAPKPDVNANEADTVQPETSPDPAATEEAELKPAQAPKEAATRIVTEAEKPSEYAPTTSDIPRARPRDMAARIAAANSPEPKPEPESNDEAADEIAKALAAAEAENIPLGPPLTGDERAGLVMAVQQCWNVPIGVQDAENLWVVLLVELNEDGSLQGMPKLIEPTGQISPLQNKAFEAGRRALIRCAPYDLPSEKYQQWRQIEVVFNPQKMAVR